MTSSFNFIILRLVACYLFSWLVSDFKGEFAALTAAFFWAVSSAIYGSLGQKISPLQLNFFKGAIAIALLILTLSLTGEINFSLQSSVVILLISGAIGIGLGDTAYFLAINHLGVRKSLLMENLTPPIAAVLGLIFLGESLSYGAWCGIFITLIGITWVISERTNVAATTDDRTLKLGIIWGILANLSQAIAAILSRFALLESDITPLQSTFVRLIGGMGIIICLLLTKKSPIKSIYSPKSVKQVLAIFIAAFAGTYLGVWLQQTAYKFTAAGIASTLTATSPLFILPLAVAMGDKISFRAILGALVALAGVTLLFTY